MKLVTFDDVRVGRIEGEHVHELAVGSTREYFERDGAADHLVRTMAPFPSRKNAREVLRRLEARH